MKLLSEKRVRLFFCSKLQRAPKGMQHEVRVSLSLYTNASYNIYYVNFFAYLVYLHTRVIKLLKLTLLIATHKAAKTVHNNISESNYRISEKLHARQNICLQCDKEAIGNF